MTTELKSTLADHAAGNYRVLMNMADEQLVEDGGQRFLGFVDNQH